MKKLVCILICVCMLVTGAGAIEPAGEGAVVIAAPSACLMERSGGIVLYEKNARDRLSPASVTKIMTLLLTVEAIEDKMLLLTDLVTCSPHAASMGGSQIWLEEGEQMTVSDMIKAVAVVSANDCAVALAEHIAGSEEAFVSKMNARASELGMADTKFMDCTGLTDDPAHLTTAYDIALMSRELISHDLIKNYTTIWMDTLRDGKSALTNTNKLVRFYDGATGLKTGFTNRAMYCLSATAERDGTEYIAVIMHAEDSKSRFDSAKALLNYAFANYAACPLRSPNALPPVPVRLGETETVQPKYSGQESVLMDKSAISGLTYELELPESVEAPVEEGQELGRLLVRSGEKTVAECPLTAGAAVERLTAFRVFGRLLKAFFSAE